MEDCIEKKERRKVKKTPFQIKIDQARELYFEGIPLDKIAEIVGWDSSDLLVIKKAQNWDRIKEIQHDPHDQIQEFQKIAQLGTIKSIYEMGLLTLAKAFKDLSIEMVMLNKKLTIEEMEAISGIVEKIDKIKRLDEFKPTENIQLAGLTIQQAKMVLNEDPFIKSIEVEYAELPAIKI